MRLRAAWLGAVVMIGPLMGSVVAKTIAIGEVVPNLEFKDIRYLRRTLSDLGTHQGLALVFLNTDCPVSKRFLPKLRELNAVYSQKDIQFVGVFCSAQDTVMEIASFALENDLRFAVVKDEENEVCAALGIDRVPQVAVLDRENRLVYRGRINDQYRVSGTQPSARREDLATALDELLAGKPISVKETPVDGCKVTPPSAPKFEPPPTFYGDVAAIMQQRCQRCHHAGTPAPFALTTLRRSEEPQRDGGRSCPRSANAPVVCGPEVRAFHQCARDDGGRTRQGRGLGERGLPRGRSGARQRHGSSPRQNGASVNPI